MIGVFWSLLMASFFGSSQLATRKGLTEIAVDQGTFIMIVVSTILMLIPFFWLKGLTLIQQAESIGLIYFVMAGLIHFVGGFTLMNISISSIGAARTGSLIATTPLFATFFAAITLGEFLNAPLVIGVIVVIVGVRLIASSHSPKMGTTQNFGQARGDSEGQSPAPPVFSNSGTNPPKTKEVSALSIASKQYSRLRLAGASTFGLLAALSWGFTPVLIKKGLESFPSPVVGVTLSMACAGVAYAIILGARGRLRPIFTSLGQPGGLWQIGAGVLVGLGTLSRWVALSFTTAAVVTTLSRASLLITVGLGGKLLGRELEPTTNRVRWGATLIVMGAIIVILFGRP